jgi:hypothetical protein
MKYPFVGTAYYSVINRVLILAVYEMSVYLVPCVAHMHHRFLLCCIQEKLYGKEAVWQGGRLGDGEGAY